jgi:anthrone oxygenase-like protein
MRRSATNLCLWIAALTLAVSVGGNLFQAMVIDPVWSASPPESVGLLAPLIGHRLGWFHGNPIYLGGLVFLFASPFLAWNSPRQRMWLLIAGSSFALVIATTLLYFHPINDVLQSYRAGKAVDPAVMRTLVRHWIVANWFRIALRVVSFLCVLRAMVLSGAPDSAR